MTLKAEARPRQGLVMTGAVPEPRTSAWPDSDNRGIDKWFRLRSKKYKGKQPLFG